MFVEVVGGQEQRDGTSRFNVEENIDYVSANNASISL